MVRQLLATYGIPCQVVSDVPHTVLPLTIDGLNVGDRNIIPAIQDINRTVAKMQVNIQHIARINGALVL